MSSRFYLNTWPTKPVGRYGGWVIVRRHWRRMCEPVQSLCSQGGSDDQGISA